MAKTTIDRRVARTRAALHDALMSLILEKGYEATTVADVCRAANVGRSTFYAHYTGKEDLKRSGLDHLRRLLVERHRTALAAAPDAHRSLAFSLPMFEHAREHIDLYRALVGGRGGAVSLAVIRETISGLVRDELALREPPGAAEDAPRELVVQFVVGAYMAVLTWWLDGGAQLPPERVDALFRRLATQGMPPPRA
jgi:AcrR family transcriptional regulator